MVNLFNRLKKATFFMVCFLTWGFAQADSDAAYTNPSDPYEKLNRIVFNFNDTLDKWVMKPIATVYNKVLPKPVTKGLSNFYFNIATLPTVVNDVLQVNFYQATSDTWRIVINSTIGLLGFFDVATSLGLERNTEDFGLTLAKWGYTNSTYVVLPFFGPSTVRDAIGLPTDYYLFSIYPHISSDKVRYGIYGTGIIAWRADLLRFQGVFDQAALDKYTFTRNAYLQRRLYLIERNRELGDPYMEKDNAAGSTYVSLARPSRLDEFK